MSTTSHTMDADRFTATLQATWEIDALCKAALQSIDNLPSDDMDGIDFVIKALVLRIDALNGAVMTALDSEATTNYIQDLIQPRAGVQ